MSVDVHVTLVVQDVKKGPGVSIIDEMVTRVPVDQADCFMPFINMHLQRHREGRACMASAAAVVGDDELDRMVHSFFETHSMICPCMHPYFDRCVQLITHVASAGTSTSSPPPRRELAKEEPPAGFPSSIPAGIMGCMLFDWRTKARRASSAWRVSSRITP